MIGPKGDTTVPNIKSAKKRVIVTDKKSGINKSEKSAVKTAIKNMNALIEKGDLEACEKAFPATVAAIDKAAQKGVFAKNTAANKKSGLAKRINALKAAK